MGLLVGPFRQPLPRSLDDIWFDFRILDGNGEFTQMK
jgi:hypothetical protein